MEYKPHTLEWTDEKVARFWNYYNHYAPYDGTWFTEVAGGLVLQFVSRHIPIRGRILDYGTGKGFLLKHLAAKYPNIEFYACDFTEDVAKDTGDKFRNEPAFRGCLHITGLPSEYESGKFDMVFLIETIEHLTDDYLHATMQEIHRVLKPGGHIIITTPNDEKIEKHFVHCADCGASFHHMQHIRSWNTSRLQTLCRDFGFEKIVCKAIQLKWYQRNGWMHRLADTLKNVYSSSKPENLVYIGKKL